MLLIRKQYGQKSENATDFSYMSDMNKCLHAVVFIHNFMVKLFVSSYNNKNKNTKKKRRKEVKKKWESGTNHFTLLKDLMY